MRRWLCGLPPAAPHAAGGRSRAFRPTSSWTSSSIFEHLTPDEIHEAIVKIDLDGVRCAALRNAAPRSRRRAAAAGRICRRTSATSCRLHRPPTLRRPPQNAIRTRLTHRGGLEPLATLPPAEADAAAVQLLRAARARPRHARRVRQPEARIRYCSTFCCGAAAVPVSFSAASRALPLRRRAPPRAPRLPLASAAAALLTALLARGSSSIRCSSRRYERGALVSART